MNTLASNPLIVLSKWIGVIITILTLTIGCVLWASTKHSDIKTFTSQQDYVITKDMKEYIKEQYVPKESFSRLEETLKGQKEDINEIKIKLDKIFEAIHNIGPSPSQ